MKEQIEMDKRNSGSGLIRDFGWYLASSFLPLLAGFLRTPIFTRYFSTEEFGNLGIVQATYSYLGILLFSWISSCLWRFYQKYKLRERSHFLNGSLLLFFSLSAVLVVVFSVAWYFLAESSLTRELIAVSCLHLIFSQWVSGYLVIVRLEARAKLYTLFQSVRAVLSLLVSLYLVFYLDQGITALITGLALVDGLALIILGLWNPIRLVFQIGGFKWEEMKELLSYGAAGLVVNLSLLSLNLSDRYVILYYEGLSSVGVYDQVYRISQLSVSALVTVFFNTINPGLFRELEADFKASLATMGRHLRVFLLAGIPLVIYLSLFSEEISNILLGRDFRNAYEIMPYIFLAAFLQGFSNFYELRLKFSSRMRLLTLVFALAAGFNLLCNLLLVPGYGYLWAAVSTTLAYLLTVLYFAYRDPSLLRSVARYKSDFAKVGVLLAVQVGIFFLVENYDPPIMIMIGMGLIFVLSCGLLLRSQLGTKY
jgi:O-antigen/teichoic acid export membrane protein